MAPTWWSASPEAPTRLHYSTVYFGYASGTIYAYYVAHLNHDFRGEEAEEDARFATALASDLALPATVERRDILVYQKGA